ncbi:MAG: transcription antitermination factor NusB [Planctomycetota bacterium]
MHFASTATIYNAMIDRRQSRILAMQFLCQIEGVGQEVLSQLDEFLADESEDVGVREYARDLVTDAWRNTTAIDGHIQAVAVRWDVKRMTTVDRNILRVAVCEMMHRSTVPPNVVINESIEIGKLFGTAESGAFINGVLDGVAKGMQATASASAATEPTA